MRAFPHRLFTVLAFALGSASCSYHGGDMAEADTRRLHWFSFVDGEDIRATCAPGTPDRFRLVYNGLYDEQVRIYEVDPIRRVLAVTVSQQGKMAAFDPSDLLAAWRGTKNKTQLDEAGYSRLIQSFEDSRMFASPPVGLSLPSHSFFWTAAFCHNGHYGLTAWKSPSAGWDGVTFDKLLYALDETGIPVNAARPVSVDPVRETMVRRGEITDFTLQVGPRGLVH